MKVQDPSQLIKGPWIRPEDLELYEGLGLQQFKIAGREQGEQWLLRAIVAYSQRRYDGPLNDLINGFDLVEPFGPLPLRIDNRALDGFLTFFHRKDCTLGCLDCNYCDLWAAKAVTADEEERERYGQLIERVLNRFTLGSFRAPLASPGKD